MGTDTRGSGNSGTGEMHKHISPGWPAREAIRFRDQDAGTSDCRGSNPGHPEVADIRAYDRITGLRFLHDVFIRQVVVDLPLHFPAVVGADPNLTFIHYDFQVAIVISGQVITIRRPVMPMAAAM